MRYCFEPDHCECQAFCDMGLVNPAATLQCMALYSHTQIAAVHSDMQPKLSCPFYFFLFVGTSYQWGPLPCLLSKIYLTTSCVLTSFLTTTTHYVPWGSRKSKSMSSATPIIPLILKSDKSTSVFGHLLLKFIEFMFRRERTAEKWKWPQPQVSHP